MRRTVAIVISGVMVLSACVIFGSYGSIPLNTSCSLDGITLSLDSCPTFVIDDEATSSMSEKQLEKKQSIVSSLNLAIQDRPELAGMLSADMIDGGSNDYYYEGGESFFKVLGEFADENYSKAQRMFPVVTCDEFYYSTAVGYAIANSWDREPLEAENPLYDDSISKDASTERYITIHPTFDEIMIHGFWAVFFNDLFKMNIDNSDSLVELENTDVESILNNPINTDMPVACQIAFMPFVESYAQWFPKQSMSSKERRDYSVGVEYGGNNVLTRSLANALYEYGLSCENEILTEPFVEIGTEAMTYILHIQDTVSQRGDVEHTVGDLGVGSWRFASYYKTDIVDKLRIGTVAVNFAVGRNDVKAGMLADCAIDTGIINTGPLESEK